MAHWHRSLPFLFVLVLLAWLAGRWSGPPADPMANAGVLIDAVHFDGYALDDADEAVRLINAGAATVDLGGWQLGDGTAAAVIPGGTRLAPGAALWLARDAAAFRLHFGHAADLQLAAWPGFSNSGDEVVLADAAGTPVDVLVYQQGDTARAGWSGPALEPYRVAGLFGGEGQILFRRRDEATGRPVADSDTAADWGQHRGDPIGGRKVRYPGWTVERFAAPAVITATGTVTVAIAPDNAYDAIRQIIDRATTSIRLSSLTLEHVGLGEALARAAQRGVAVVVLLDGAPPGGLNDQERYVCGQLEAAGGMCWFMTGDDARRVHGRYRYLHAKYLVIDDRIAAISTENFSPDSLPDDDKHDGTWGRRGVVVITDVRAVAAHLAALFAADLDVAHADLRRWTSADPVYGAPPAGFVPITASGGISYTVRFPQPVAFYGTHRFEIIQAPENSLRAGDGLTGLLAKAGAGDALLFEQLSERPHWGASSSTAAADPNPRLEAALAAARRGAAVTLLLDSFFDSAGSATSNAATCAYVNETAAREGLRLHCATGNPTGLGIHNKMVLARIDGQGVVHVGSLNGTELSHKANRELAVHIHSDAIYAYLARVFAGDMSSRLHLPVVLAGFDGPADHLLISEIVYDPPGPDEAEFVELVNPTGAPIDLTGYALGDAVSALDFEDMRHFPPGASVPAGGVVVVALSAAAVRAEYDIDPHFEIVDSDPNVPDLIDDPAWGDPAALFQLGNAGDEVVVIRWDGLVDVVTYGSGYHSGVVGCALLVPPARTLERRPFWRDSDRCPADFRAWPFPSPGRVGP